MDAGVDRALSFRARLTLAFALIAATLTLAVLVAVSSLARLGGAVDTILRENYVSVIAAEDMKEALEREDSAAVFAAAGHEDLARPQMVTARAGFDRALAREAANVTLPGEYALVASLRANYVAYVAASDAALARAPPERREAYFRDLLPRFVALKDTVQQVLRINQQNMEAADRAARRIARWSIRVVVAVSVLAVLLTVAAAWALPRILVQPIRALTETARAVGEGDFDVTVAVPAATELARLAETFAKMIEKLRAYRDSSLGELLAARDLANSTLECMLDPVIVFAEAGAVVLANAAAERAFGVRTGTAEELRDAGVRIPAELLEARDRAVDTGEPVLPSNFAQAVRRQGREGERYFLVRAAPLHFEAGDRLGEHVGAIVVAQDITRFRRIDELKSDVVAVVSHEFKTPLTSLRMATHMLLEATLGPLTAAQRELAETARDDTERLHTLVDELLDVARIESEAGALRKLFVEPAVLLGQVAEAHRALAVEKGIALEVSASTVAGAFRMDPERMAIALANLVSNAIRHTPEGGTVLLGAARAGETLTLTVRDTGEGIAPQDLPRIFDRGYRSGRAEDGDTRRQGLGLAIAREIVALHGGQLSAASSPGAGATFTVALPAQDDRTAP